MKVRALSPTGDMTFGAGQANFLVDSPVAIAQLAKTTLRLWYGEWYQNITAGTPYPESILGYNSKATADNAIQTQLLGVTVIVSSTNVPNGTSPGQSVQAITSIANYSSSVDPVTRAYTVTCLLNTIYGPTAFQYAYQNDF